MADLHARYNEVEKLMDAGQDVEAVAGLNEILAEDEGFVLAHLALSRVLTRTGDHVQAIAHADRACELEPNEAFNYTAKSVTCQRAWAGTQDQKYIQMAEDAMAQAHAIQANQ
ncbi:hypothetical protein CA51_08000 [Rosistilla oblonga]|uniref:Uncharacterized protein n=1 Tax=Rosistilla oblonga TaxID=2527990 RepID=A0A518INW5_9BACT|nr:scaffolding protein [Rosistilla oblonga]QDV10941.1 hypothetical protein CA51_08000 [Rosistilla oblonga]QDV54778.1 hypothetical protein Mal33_07430 [Rosistilla oblonga]